MKKAKQQVEQMEGKKAQEKAGEQKKTGSVTSRVSDRALLGRGHVTHLINHG